ncbi:lytic transglycosylase domain-containing protein [Ruegeria atlantica]|uniref:lytic transglycosylase domain-containing protein n=1 Tax=Ruegeria atlantica TaxID=81569 RepID=UPI0020C4D951|nr:lytic transglycosylase domain-containing protein [Ruegeria atlantica]
MQTIWKWDRNDTSCLKQPRGRHKNASLTSCWGVAFTLVLLFFLSFTNAGDAQVIEYEPDGSVYLNGARAELVEGVVQPMRLHDRETTKSVRETKQPYTSGETEISGRAPRPKGPSGGWSRARIVAEVRAAAHRHGIPADLFMTLIWQESRFRADAVSPKGAIGFAQLMPGTARDLGVDPKAPAENLDGGARYLAAQYRAFGTWELALAAYNAGPHRVIQYGGVPPFSETRHYVRTILSKVSTS